MAIKPSKAGKKLSEESMNRIKEMETEIDCNINLHYNGAEKIKIDVYTKDCRLSLNEILALEKIYKNVGWKKITYRQGGYNHENKITLHA